MSKCFCIYRQLPEGHFELIGSAANAIVAIHRANALFDNGSELVCVTDARGEIEYTLRANCDVLPRLPREVK